MNMGNEILAEYFKYCEIYFNSEDLIKKKNALQLIGKLNVKRGKLVSNLDILVFYALCGGLTKFTDPRPATNSVNIESDNYLKKQYDSKN